MGFFCENLPDLDYAEYAIGVTAFEGLTLIGIISLEPPAP